MDFVRIVVQVGMKEKERMIAYYAELQLVKEVGIIKPFKL